TAEGERPVDVFFPNAVAQEAAAAKANAKSASRAKVANEDRPADAGPELREVPGATLTHLRLDENIPNRVQPRTEFDDEALERVTRWTREFGVFQPVVVRESVPAPAAGEPRYELIMGERRFRSSGRAGLTEIPAIIRSTADEHMLRDALLENLHR